MSSKTFKLVSLLAIPALLLTGCSASGSNSYGMDDVQITDYPSWAESSISGLEKAGWEINDSLNLPVSETENIKFPDIYTAISPSGDCQVSFNSEMYTPWNNNSDDSFNTQRFILSELERKLSPELKTAELKTASIKVDGEEKTLEALTTTYSYPNRVYDETVGPEALIPYTKEDGTFNAMIIARTLPTSLPNLAAQLSFNKNVKLPKESKSAVSIQYQCLNEKLDDKIIKLISEDASLKLFVKNN